MTIDPGIKKRFLIRIVDDDVGVRTGLTFLLKCLGWSSVDYLSAEEFLQKDNMLIPGCILLDIRMPGMSGLALQQKLFSDGVQLPVVIITGYADVETAVRTLKRGAFDFLEKPIEAEKLDAVLENCWNRWNVKNSGQRPQEIAAIFHEMSEREKGIVRLLVQELTSKQIGDRLGLSERTVQGHRLNLYKKFGVHTRDELLSCLKVMEELSEQGKRKRKILLQLSIVIEGADRIWLELTDYGFGQESLWINIRRSKHGSRVVASTP